MLGNIFYQADPFFICLVLMGVFVAAFEIGSRIEKWRRKGVSGSAEKVGVGLILSGLLTLMALMLGFTYTLSEARFEKRRQLVIDEANALRTAYMRTETLPEPQRFEIRDLLRQYTANRVQITTITDITPKKILNANTRAKQLQNMMWSRGVTIVRESPTLVNIVFLESLNATTMMYTSRLAAYNNRVPASIYLVLFVESTIIMILTGYYFGSMGRSGRTLTTILALLLVSVMWLTMDLDQPTRGAIRASQQSLIDLNSDMIQAPPDRPVESRGVKVQQTVR
jgi:hypothetical protein